MEITVSNATYKKLWDLMIAEGLDNNGYHIEPALGFLLDEHEKLKAGISWGGG